jgi:hypothetical protein
MRLAREKSCRGCAHPRDSRIGDAGQLKRFLTTIYWQEFSSQRLKSTLARKAA